MRVAHVGDYALEGAVGVSKVVAELTASLKKAGVEPEVWRLSESNVTVSENPQDDIELIELPVRSRAETALRGLPRATKEFIRDRRGSIDIVHLHSVFTPHNVLVATQAATPYVLSPHGGYSHEVLHGRNRWAKFVWMRLHERRYVLRSTAVHALSEREAIYLQSVFPGIRTAVIPNAIAPLEPKTEALNVSPRLLFLGRLALVADLLAELSWTGIASLNFLVPADGIPRLHRFQRALFRLV